MIGLLHSPHITTLFEISGFQLQTWGFMFVIAFLVSLFLILREAKKQSIDAKHIYNIALLTLLGAIIGARFFYVFEHLGFFLQNPQQIFLIWPGGLTSYGAVLAVFCVWFYISRQKDIRCGQIFDIIAPYLALAIAIIRIGCFLRGCCGGEEHPTQLYESLYSFFIFFVLLKFKKIRDKAKRTRFSLLLSKKGYLFLLFLILYSFFRFFNDFLRTYENYFLGLALSQWLLLGIFVLSIIFLKHSK